MMKWLVTFAMKDAEVGEYDLLATIDADDAVTAASEGWNEVLPNDEDVVKLVVERLEA